MEPLRGSPLQLIAFPNEAFAQKRSATSGLYTCMASGQYICTIPTKPHQIPNNSSPHACCILGRRPYMCITPPWRSLGGELRQSCKRTSVRFNVEILYQNYFYETPQDFRQQFDASILNIWPETIHVHNPAVAKPRWGTPATM